jgi:hypothetical protein
MSESKTCPSSIVQAVNSKACKGCRRQLGHAELQYYLTLQALLTKVYEEMCAAIPIPHSAEEHKQCTAAWYQYDAQYDPSDPCNLPMTFLNMKQTERQFCLITRLEDEQAARGAPYEVYCIDNLLAFEKNLKKGYCCRCYKNYGGYGSCTKYC